MVSGLLPRGWKIEFGHVNKASTCSNTFTGAGREIDLAFALLFLGGKVFVEWNPMNPHLRLGPRFRSDHHIVVVLPGESWPPGREEELKPLRAMLARLNASAASYSAAALEKLGTGDWKAKVEDVRKQTIEAVYEGLSRAAREMVYRFLKKMRVLRARERAARG
jgi:hypothetical protein